MAQIGRKVAHVDPAINKLDEKSLIERARGGDTDSFSALVELHQERALHAANGFVGNIEDARDLAQEAFIKAYENLDSFKLDSKFYTWYYRILMNTCKDFLRKKKVRKTFSFFFGKDEEGNEADPVADIADKQESVREGMDRKHFGVAVQDALDRLPFRQKSAFVLRYTEGMPLDEIADSMQISVGAVKANLWQAGQKMKVLLKDYLKDNQQGSMFSEGRLS